MSLTTEQRLQLYDKALFFLRGPRLRDHSICFCLFKAQIVLKTGYHTLDTFKEIIKQRPEHISSLYPSQSWFPLNEEGTQKRIAILEQAIEDCKQQLKQQHEVE